MLSLCFNVVAALVVVVVVVCRHGTTLPVPRSCGGFLNFFKGVTLKKKIVQN